MAALWPELAQAAAPAAYLRQIEHPCEKKNATLVFPSWFSDDLAQNCQAWKCCNFPVEETLGAIMADGV